MYRRRKKQQSYQDMPAEVECPFCVAKAAGRVIEETEHAYVIDNLFSYDLWEFRDVLDHRMIVPKRHVGQLYALTKTERADIMELMAKYEAQYYDIFARSATSATKSILAHQHTHLIKTAAESAKFALYVRKPYLLHKR